MDEDIELLTVIQLQDKLKELNLATSGRKAELCQRLRDHFSKADVDGADSQHSNDKVNKEDDDSDEVFFDSFAKTSLASKGHSNVLASMYNYSMTFPNDRLRRICNFCSMMVRLRSLGKLKNVSLSIIYRSFVRNSKCSSIISVHEFFFL